MSTTIPYDIYESDSEIVVIMPLGWVAKDSISVFLEKNVVHVKWTRKRPELKDDLIPQKQDCYWWDFEAKIQLPLTVYFDRIQPSLTKENILILVIPKYKLPDNLKLEIQLLN